MSPGCRIQSLLKRFWNALNTDEDGAAQTVGLIATFPAVVLLTSMFVELLFILETRLAVLDAARVAARSAIVWESEGPEVALMKARQGAALALTPIASPFDRNQPSAVPDETQQHAIELADLLDRAYPQRYSRDAILSKYVQAHEGTMVEIEHIQDDETGRRQLRVRVSYNYAFMFGIFGRLAGTRAGPDSRGFTRPLVAEFLREAQEAIPDGLDIGYRPEP